MNQARRLRHKQLPQSGAALLIAIFALMLISVVAIALIVSQGTDSALAGNYRTSIGAYYAGVAGLEEARGRLLWKNTNCVVNRPNSPPLPDCPNPGFVAASAVSLGASMNLTDVRYILNPASGETVNPTGGSAADFADTEYGQEFPSWGLGGAVVQQTSSIYPVAGLVGPSYKWVRINPITEAAINLDVNNDGVKDSAIPLYYDPTKIDATNKPTPGLFVPTSAFLTPPPPSVQALEITALAAMPAGGRRLLQYIVVPLFISTSLSQPSGTAFPAFPAALTLIGNNVNYNATGFNISGLDGCKSPSLPPNFAIGFTNPGSGSQVNVTAGAKPPATYFGSYGDVTSLIRQSWQAPTTLDQVVQDVTNNADFVYNGNTTANSFLTPMAMTSATQPLTIVVNGNLNMTSWPHTGNGLLLVTGTLTFDSSTSWNGIIMVIGQGKVDFVSNGIGGVINGSMVIAKTRGFGNTLLTSLGAASFRETGGSGGATGAGLTYNSCTMSSAGSTTPIAYKILSFREIPSN